jgi:uncharacterized membrane protein
MAAARFVPLGLSLAFVAASLLRLASKLGELPPVMASHFDAQGRADGFQGRSAFVLTAVGMQLGFLAVFALLPWLIERMPARLINLPHRDHWLAPERKAQTVARMAVLLDWFALATVGLLAATFELVLRANLEQRPLANGPMWLLLASYFVFLALWIARFVRAFPRPA